jgi:N utilization substance protein A
MDIAADTKRAVSALFGDVEDEEITRLAELPEIPPRIVDILERRGIELIETLVGMNDEDLRSIDELSSEDVSMLNRIIAESVEIIEDEVEEDVPIEPVTTDVTEDADEEADVDDEHVDADLDDSEDEEEEITLISELPDVPDNVVERLAAAGVTEVVDLLQMTGKQLKAVEGLSDEEVELIQEIVRESVEIIEDDEDEDY